ncbi:MAG: hypothetical protein JRJ57_03540 [Deltaproteobacteria bacterium]|nr:hypothetical protein [Deltaproteobacteria bacterium]
MKKLLIVLAIISLMGFTFATGPALAGDLAAKVMVANPYQKLDNKAKVTIVGTGFKPGQQVSLLFTSADGVQADIGYALKPAPKANKIGSWVTTWSCGRFIKKKLIKKGAYTITVTDSDYNVITHTPVAFYKAKKSKKKKK